MSKRDISSHILISPRIRDDYMSKVAEFVNNNKSLITDIRTCNDEIMYISKGELVIEVQASNGDVLFSVSYPENWGWKLIIPGNQSEGLH